MKILSTDKLQGHAFELNIQVKWTKSSNGCVFSLAVVGNFLDWVRAYDFICLGAFSQRNRSIILRLPEKRDSALLLLFSSSKFTNGLCFSESVGVIKLSSDQRLSAIIESKHTKCVDSSWEGRVHLPNYYKI